DIQFVFIFLLIKTLPPNSTLFPYTTLFRSTNLQVRNVSEPKPGKGKGGQDSKNERSETFHQCATISPGSGFTGFKNVGTLDVRRSEEHTSELQSRFDLVCRLLLEKKKRARR